MQDIVVYISLDTAAQEKPTLLPLILSFEGESAYKASRWISLRPVP